MTYLWLILLAVLIVVLVVVIKCFYGSVLIRKYSRDSLIVFGKKGKGKTLLFSEMARRSRRGYLSTTDFKHRKQVLIDYSAVNVSPNDWQAVLDGKVTAIPRREDWEGRPVLLDDAGIYLPNFADSELKKKYPSMPIAYAVWRHLYDAPIHINSQDVERCWKMVREQADGFLRCRGTVRLGPLAIVRCTYYSNIDSARRCIAPMRSRLINKYSRAEVDLFNAEHGEVKDFWIFAPAWRNKYDSRYFRSVFFE